MSLLGMKAKNHPQQVDAHGAADEVDDRATHPSLFQQLDLQHHFTIDVAASPANTKCAYCARNTTDGGIPRRKRDHVEETD